GSDGLQHAGLDEGPDRSQERRMVRPDAMQEVEDREHRRQLVPEPAPLAVALVQAVQLAQRYPRALRRLRQVATLRPRAARVRPDRRLEDGMGLAPVVEARREIEDPREIRRQLQLEDQVEGSLRGLPAVSGDRLPGVEAEVLAPRRLVGVLVGRARPVPALCRDRRRPLPWRLAGESPIDVVATPRGIDENHLTGITIRLTESSPLAIQVVPHPRPAPFLERGTRDRK